jgi:hypothetical protein
MGVSASQEPGGGAFNFRDIGENRSQCDGVDAQVAIRIIQRRRPGEADDAVLGRDVPGQPADALKTGGCRQ